MLIQFQIVLVLVLVLENSFQPHRRNFVRLCQAEWQQNGGNLPGDLLNQWNLWPSNSDQ
jgi:hypothetical protein